MKENHFLDSNIIINSLGQLESNGRKYSDYIESDTSVKITSKRAFNECRGYFNRQREAMLRFLNHCYENASRFRQQDMEREMLKEADKIFVDKRDIDAAKKLMETKGPETRQAICGPRALFDEFCAKITEVAGYALSKLTITCANFAGAKIKRFDACPHRYEKTGYEELFGKLDAIIQYEKDSLIVMDSKFFNDTLCGKTKQKNGISFVTEDRKHILSNKSGIEALLAGVKIESFGEANS